MTPTIEDDALHFFDKHKQTFRGINAGDYIDKEDFEKFAASLNRQGWTRVGEIENLKKERDGWKNSNDNSYNLWRKEEAKNIKLQKEILELNAENSGLRYSISELKEKLNKPSI